ncbi:MAG: FG-GAP-like repeat-containing protein, partial [Cyclobacteriaceae bacterium]|nr:FG-GAP-like repeat-containing protein [Cyclobacteriaceae bacterium]
PVVPLSNYAFINNKNLTFKNATQDLGLDIPSFSSGCAYGDLDGDGDLDLVVNNVNMEAFIFRNESRQVSDNNFLQFQFKGNKGNTFAIGTSIKLFIGESTITQELMPSRGFQSSMDYVMTFGLGEHNQVDSISVLWPDNKITILQNVTANQKIVLLQSDAKDWKGPVKEITKRSIFVEVSKNAFEDHQEDPFDDFDQEGLIVKHLSKEGPALAVGDINMDGHEDIFIGGAKGQPGKLYLHSGSGNLKLSLNDCFTVDAGFEDTAAAFFDADGDGDLDLAVGSGGNIASEKGSYITRLYLNIGNGNFERSKSNLPSAKSNISILAPQDFDIDGDIDLFVGSRSVPGVFGINPQHLLLINNGDGTFSDGTERYAYDLKEAGMVTDAKWVDIDGDKKLDLVTISEWGAPLVLKNSGRRLTKWNCSLDSLYGWWKVMESSDLDGDGDQDLILGNSGLNIPYVATKEKPMKLWINDFDENGTIEQITTSHNDGDYPIHMKKELNEQLPSLKKQNLKATDYAIRTIQELFKPDIVNNALVKTVNVSESVVAVNEGNGKFRIVNLPDRVQWSCVCGISCTDVNGDGDLDLVMAGNHFEFKPQFSRQDASYGHVLLGDGKLGFEWKTYSESGFFIRDQVRHLKPFTDKSGKRFMFAAINNEKPRVFEYYQQ